MPSRKMTTGLFWRRLTLALFATLIVLLLYTSLSIQTDSFQQLWAFDALAEDVSLPSAGNFRDSKPAHRAPVFEARRSVAACAAGAAAPDAERVECARPGQRVDAAVCADNGCCWAPAMRAGAPWCFRSPKYSEAIAEREFEHECAVATAGALDARGECATPGAPVDAGSCQRNGCCWAAASGAHPRCFKRASAAALRADEAFETRCSAVETRYSDRAECAEPGRAMSAGLCKARGCCWRAAPSVAVPWCFRPF